MSAPLTLRDRLLNAAAETNALKNTAARAEYAIKQALAGLPVDPEPAAPQPPPVAFSAIPHEKLFTFAGQGFLAHCGPSNPIMAGSDGSIICTALGGQRASFDGANKIRCEGLSQRRTEAGETVERRAGITFEPIGDISLFHEKTGWLIIWQQHTADSRRADGSGVGSSPPAAVKIVREGDRYFVRASIREAYRGIPAPGFQAKETLIGRAEVFPGKEFALEVRVTNSHGAADGAVFVAVDGMIVADFHGPVGFDFPDLLKGVLVGGKPQDHRDYEKGPGIYAGVYSGSVPSTVGLKLSARPLP